jgi:hypothetical protein
VDLLGVTPSRTRRYFRGVPDYRRRRHILLRKALSATVVGLRDSDRGQPHEQELVASSVTDEATPDSKPLVKLGLLADCTFATFGLGVELPWAFGDDRRGARLHGASSGAMTVTFPPEGG